MITFEKLQLAKGMITPPGITNDTQAVANTEILGWQQ